MSPTWEDFDSYDSLNGLSWIFTEIRTPRLPTLRVYMILVYMLLFQSLSLFHIFIHSWLCFFFVWFFGFIILLITINSVVLSNGQHHSSHCLWVSLLPVLLFVVFVFTASSLCHVIFLLLCLPSCLSWPFFAWVRVWQPFSASSCQSHSLS